MALKVLEYTVKVYMVNTVKSSAKGFSFARFTDFLFTHKLYPTGIAWYVTVMSL